MKVIPQIESTSGLADIKEILTAGGQRFIAAAFGADDFTADFEVHRTEGAAELDFARKYFALCCHARKVISIDTPFVKFKDTLGLQKDLEYLKTIGMKAKFAIHPVSIITYLKRTNLDSSRYNQRRFQAAPRTSRILQAHGFAL